MMLSSDMESTITIVSGGSRAHYVYCRGRTSTMKLSVIVDIWRYSVTSPEWLDAVIPFEV